MKKATFDFNCPLQFLADRVRFLPGASNFEYKLAGEYRDSTGEWVMQFRHGITMGSWGQKIDVRLRSLAAEQTSVEISSKSVYGFSWGWHQKNIDYFHRWMYAGAVEYAARMAAAATVQTCPRCGATASAGTRFCTNCGTSFASSAQVQPSRAI